MDNAKTPNDAAFCPSAPKLGQAGPDRREIMLGLMALAGLHDLPTILVPGGVMLPPESGEDAGAVQTIGARFARGMLTLDEAPRRAELQLQPLPQRRKHRQSR